MAPTEINEMNGNIAKLAGASALVIALAGCSTMDYQERGTLVGAGIGAAAGAALTGDTLGAVGGGVVGGVIGNQIGRNRDERYDRYGYRDRNTRDDYYRNGYYDRDYYYDNRRWYRY